MHSIITNNSYFSINIITVNMYLEVVYYKQVLKNTASDRSDIIET